MKKLVLYLSIIVIFYSCHGLALEEKIVENYYLIAGDDPEGTFLSYHDSSDGNNFSALINATVFAAGYNDDYMIVKQHPRTFPNPPDKKITNYYILPLKKGMDWKNKNGLIGPLTLLEFSEKRKELNIPNEVKFTIVIKDMQ